MLVYDENRQMERANAIMDLLEIGELSPWAESYWKSVLARLSRSQVQLEYAFNKATNA